MSIEEMKEFLKKQGIPYSEVSKCTGIPLSTLQKIFGNTTGAPRFKTRLALNEYFDQISDECSYVEETASEYGMTDGTSALNRNTFGDKTLDDYLALPDDVRVELIDGTFYDMAAPTAAHQQISQLLTSRFQNHIDTHKGSCMVFAAPFDVRLDCDDKTMVQPDILVICDRDKLSKPRLNGAPDLVVEIISASSWFHDTIRKFNKYKKAGVHEYWIIIPSLRKILVYFFEQSSEPAEYTFSDSIPVNIWNGKCVIDFKEIFNRIEFLL